MSKNNMRYRPLGRSGLQVSELSIGGWTTYGDSVQDAAMVRKILVRAYEAGINFFDIADIYARGKTETAMGLVLKEFPRHTLVISSKVFWPMSDDVNDRGLSRKHIFESVHKSLQRLGADYLDMYFCHRFDEKTPLEETVRAMDDLVRQGKVLYWGTSEWTGAQIREAGKIAEKRNAYGPQVEQPQYSMLVRTKVEKDVRPATDAQGMGLVVWSPLASGLLTGKYDDGIPPGSRLAQIAWLRDAVRNEENLARVRKLKPLAEELGCSRASLALAWCAAQPGISSVITGATRIEQLDENLKALDVKLDAAMLKKLDAVCPA